MRLSGIEFLRLLSMFFIVSVHYSCHGLSFFEGSNIELAYFFANYGQIGVCCFVFIGSWFLCDKQFRLERIISIWKESFFYSVSIGILCFLIWPDDYNFKELIYGMFPVIYVRYWFVSPYLFLLLLSPVINSYLNSINVSKRRLCLIILLVLVSVIPSVFIKSDPFGYNIFRFVLVYVLAYTIKKKVIKIEFKKNYMNLLLFFLISSIMLLFGIILHFIGPDSSVLNDLSKYYPFNFATLPVIVSSTYLFLFFKNINVSSKIVNYISKYTFGIYLISEHVGLSNNLWLKVLNTQSLLYIPWFYYIIYSFIIITCVYLSCLFVNIILHIIIIDRLDISRIIKDKFKFIISKEF